MANTTANTIAETTVKTANLTYSTELLTQYLQSEVVSPDSKFQALQSPDGHSLLFSIGTDGVFYLIEEMPQTTTGWQKNDLSSGLASEFKFPAGSKIVAKNFEAAQNTANATFTVALVVTVSETDYLYVASSYTRDADNFITLNWVPMTYDAANKTADKLNISAVTVLQTTSYPLLVVDTVPSGMTTIERYYIDTTKKMKGTYWYLYTLPFNMTAEGASTCGGRKGGESVDGIYSCGQVAGKWTIAYQQLYNPFNTAMAGAASQLLLEGSPVKIACTPSVTVPNAGSGAATITYTDLYTSTLEGDLYLFAANKQANNVQNQAVFIMNNALFKNLTALYAFNTGQKVVVWGLNRQQQIFYTQCAIETVSGKKQFSADGWTYPMVLATDVVQISPYANRVNGGNTYFAHVGTNTLKKVFQDPITTNWQTQQIQLPLLNPDPLPELNSYTTKFMLKDTDGVAVSGGYLSINSSCRIPTYINNRYYVLDTAPIMIPATNGSLTIMQPMNEDMQSATLKVQVYLDMNYDANATIQYNNDTLGQKTPLKPVNLVVSSESILINPMEKGTNKMLALNDPDTLAATTYTDDAGKNPQSLVTTTDPTALNNTAGSLTQLTTVSSSLAPIDPTAVAKMSAKMRRAFIGHRGYIVHENGVAKFKIRKKRKPKPAQAQMGTPQYDVVVVEENEVAAGDLFQKLKSVRANWIEIRENTHDKVWEFVCEFADGVVKFVIDTVDKVVGAIQAVLQAVGAVIRGLLQFVKFLFSWDDILLTAQVNGKILKIIMNDLIFSIDGVLFKDKIKGIIAKANDLIDDVIGYKDTPCPSFDDSCAESTAPPPTTTTTTTTDDGSVSDDYLQNMLTANGEDADLHYGPDVDDSTKLEELFGIIKTLIDNATDDIRAACNDLYNQLLKDFAFRDKSILQVLQTALGILTDLVCNVAEDILCALVDILVELLDGIWNLLSTGLWIPILSPVLKKFFKIEIPSAIDLLLLVSAMPATMSYKLLNGKAPYDATDPAIEAILKLKEQTNNRADAAVQKKALMDILKPTAPNGAAAKASDNQIINNFYMVSRSATCFNDLFSAILVVPDNVKGVKKLKNINILTYANNAVRYMFDISANNLVDPPFQADGPIFWDTFNSVINIGLLSQKVLLLGTKLRRKKDSKTFVEDGEFIDTLDAVGESCFRAIGNISTGATLIKYLLQLGTRDRNDTVILDAGIAFCCTGNANINALLKVVPKPVPGATALTTVLAGTSVVVSGVSLCMRGVEAAKAGLLD